MQYIGLLDCNNFFVSCERLFRPDLLKKPVVVLSSNDGCVVARSQEIKDKGIPMGVPYFQVKDTLSDMDAVLFSSHFALYRDISRRVFAVARRELGEIEQYSIDECFFLVESSEAEEIIGRVKRVIEREVGIPVSCGVATSKTQAKYASAIAKKTSGLKVLSPQEWQKQQTDIPLAALWGVGAARAKNFSAFGLKTVADFLALPVAVIGQHFGIEGVKLYQECSAIVADPNSVGRIITPKTVMSSRSFAEPSTEFGVIESALSYHLHELVRGLWEKDLLAKTVRIFIYSSRYSDYFLQGASEQIECTVATNDLFLLKKHVSTLLGRAFRSDVPYQRAGVVLGVESPVGHTAPLFAEPHVATREVSAVVAAINKRFKDTPVRLGSVAKPKNGAWLSRRSRLSPGYTTQWAEVCRVHAV